MGNCSGVLQQVGSLPPIDIPDPPPPDREEIYKDLKTHLGEICDTAYDLQRTFGKDVIKDTKVIAAIKQIVTNYSMMTPLSNKEAEQTANSKNKVLERYWFKRSRNVILSVINRLKDVRKHNNVSTNQQKTNLDTMIYKLKTDSLNVLKNAINQPINDLNDAQNTDEGDTNRSSEETHEDVTTSSSNCLETGKTIECRYDVQKEDFGLLFSCSLILETERDNYSKLHLYKSHVEATI